MKKEASTLAKDYQLGNNEHAYYEYIINSLINGNRDQVRRLFNQMRKHNQREFLIDFIDPSIGYHKSALNICISELTT
jgi:hypothetical protein